MAALWAPDRCPDAERLHTPCPSGYVSWHEWAKRKGKTHKQHRCPTCGLLSIWRPKPRPVDPEEG